DRERPRIRPRRVRRENFTGTSSPVVFVSSVRGIAYSFPSVGPGFGFGSFGVFGIGADGGGGVPPEPPSLPGSVVLPVFCAPLAAVSAWFPTSLPASGPASAASLATTTPATTGAAGPVLAAVSVPASAVAVSVPAVSVLAGGFAAGGLPPPSLSPPLSPEPSRIFFGPSPPALDGIGRGRFMAFFASCSAPMLLYRSKPTKLMS